MVGNWRGNKACLFTAENNQIFTRDYNSHKIGVLNGKRCKLKCILELSFIICVEYNSLLYIDLDKLKSVGSAGESVYSSLILSVKPYGI